MVPEEWEKVQLGEITKLTMGYAFKSSDFVVEGIPLVRMGNLYQNRLDLKRSPVFLPVYYASEFKRFLLNPGDLLMSLTGTMGKRDYGFVVSIPDNCQQLLLNQRVAKISPTHRSRADFLKYLLASNAVLEQIYSAPGGTKQANISGANLRALQCQLPPLPEQKKIAEILSTWDRAIEVAERQLETARLQKKALMQQLLTGTSRLPGFDGEWKTVKLGDAVQIISRKNNGADLPITMISSKIGFVRQDEKYSRYMAGESAKQYTVLRRGEFAYNKGNSISFPFGCVFRLDTFDEALVPHVYFCFRFRSGYEPDFFRYLFSADYLKPQLSRLVNTGVRNNGLLNIRSSQFWGVTLPVPPQDEQVKIAAVLKTANDVVQKLDKKLTHLRTEKRALMQQLLTGKKRVKV